MEFYLIVFQIFLNPPMRLYSNNLSYGSLKTNAAENCWYLTTTIGIGFCQGTKSYFWVGLDGEDVEYNITFFFFEIDSDQNYQKA